MLIRRDLLLSPSLSRWRWVALCLASQFLRLSCTPPLIFDEDAALKGPVISKPTINPGQSLEALMDLEGILRGFVCWGAFCHSGRPSAHLGLSAKGGHTLGRLLQALSPTFWGASAKSTGTQARAHTCALQTCAERGRLEVGPTVWRSARYSEANIKP